MVSAGVGTQSDSGKIDWWTISKMWKSGGNQLGTETAGLLWKTALYSETLRTMSERPRPHLAVPSVRVRQCAHAHTTDAVSCPVLEVGGLSLSRFLSTPSCYALVVLYRKKA